MQKKLLFTFLAVFIVLFSFTLISNQPILAACDCSTVTQQCNADCVEAIEGIPCTTIADCSTISNSNCALCTVLEFITIVAPPWIFGIALLTALIFIVIGGIRYVTAGDDEKKIADAKGTFKWSIVGLIIVILATAIIRLIWSFFGFEEDKIFVIPTNDPLVINCNRCQN